MMRRSILAVVLFLLGSRAVADSCYISDKDWEVLSPNGGWRLVVNPEHRATLFRKGRIRTWRKESRWTLANSPARAFVLNDGTTVTLDTGCASGFGDNVVVIFRPDGALVRRLALKDILLEEDIELFPRSVSSIQWAGQHRVDEEKRQIILQVKGPQTVEIPISIDDGTLLVPKRRLFTRQYLTATISYSTAPDVESSKRKCDGGVLVRSADLLAHATAPTFPTYPRSAFLARIQGTVVLEVAVNDRGTVDSVVVVKGLPFGLADTARDAAGKWQFTPARRDERNVGMCGQFSINFALNRADG